MKNSKHKTNAERAWQDTFRQAMHAREPLELKCRLRDAKHAIMDRIEDTMRTASQSERRMLGVALDIVSTLERSSSLAEHTRIEIDYPSNIAA
jgi:hypothetical protein